MIRLGTKSFAAYAGLRPISGRRRAALCSFLRYVLTLQSAINLSSILWQLLCVLLLILGRFVVFAVPWFLAKLVSVFEEGVTSSPWPYLFGYVGLQFLKSSGGLSALRDVCSTCLQLFHTPFISISSVGSLGPSDAIFGSR